MQGWGDFAVITLSGAGFEASLAPDDAFLIGAVAVEAAGANLGRQAAIKARPLILHWPTLSANDGEALSISRPPLLCPRAVERRSGARRNEFASHFPRPAATAATIAGARIPGYDRARINRPARFGPSGKEDDGLR